MIQMNMQYFNMKHSYEKNPSVLSFRKIWRKKYPNFSAHKAKSQKISPNGEKCTPKWTIHIFENIEKKF